VCDVLVIVVVLRAYVSVRSPPKEESTHRNHNSVDFRYIFNITRCLFMLAVRIIEEQLSPRQNTQLVNRAGPMNENGEHRCEKTGSNRIRTPRPSRAVAGSCGISTK
jgi:hypothetical protein